jgi:polyisoprenoid-binding protein YceI
MKLPVIRTPNQLRLSTALATLAAVAFSLGPVARAGAQTSYKSSSQPHASSVRVNGTSTAHDWEMEGVLIGGTLEFGAGVKLDKAQADPAGLQDNKAPAKAHVIIPVRSIRAKVDHLPEVMNDLMRKAMKEDKFATIEFTLTSLTFKGPHTAGQPFNFETAGELSIAGVTNKVSFPVTIDCLEEGKIKVSGSAPVKMTAYGIEPPAPNFGLGLMKCGDDVKISFDWTLKERK